VSLKGIPSTIPKPAWQIALVPKIILPFACLGQVCLGSEHDKKLPIALAELLPNGCVQSQMKQVEKSRHRADAEQQSEPRCEI